MFISRLNATFVPDDAKHVSSRRFLSPTLGSTLSRIALTTIVGGIVLGAVYNWTNPAIFILWAVSIFVESLPSSTQSELNPKAEFVFPWEGAFCLRACVGPVLIRVVAYALLSILFRPGIEGMFIYLSVSLGASWVRASMQKSLVDCLGEPLRFMNSSTTESRQVLLFHRCILGDRFLADQATKCPPQSPEPNRLIKFETDLYDDLSERYTYALGRPSNLTDHEFVCDLLKLSALEVVANGDTMFGDETMLPQIIRAVCIFLGGTGRRLSACKQSVDGKRLVEWHLAPTFFVAVRHGLEALRTQLSKQRRDCVILAPVGLKAIHHFVVGLNDFAAHDRSVALHLRELETLSVAAAKDINRATGSIETTGVHVNAFQDGGTMAWITSLGN